jgi:hypothetical protein
VQGLAEKPNRLHGDEQAVRIVAELGEPKPQVEVARVVVAGVEHDAVGRDVGARAVAALECVDQEELADARTLACLVDREAAEQSGRDGIGEAAPFLEQGGSAPGEERRGRLSGTVEG